MFSLVEKTYDTTPQWLYVALLLVLCIAALVIFTRKGVIYIQLKRMLTVMFAEYLVLLLCFTIIYREESDYSVRLVPIMNYFGKSLCPLEDALMNLAMFLPVGFCTSVLLRRPFWLKILLLSSILSCCIELSQFVLSRGVCDINDVINNAIGGLLGYWAYRIARTVKVLNCKE